MYRRTLYTAIVILLSVAALSSCRVVPSRYICSGNDLPPCYVVQRESRFDPQAENPTSTASGLYQFLDGTWAGYKGYGHASHAPVHVQVERARQIWNGGRGCGHWNACV